MKVPALFLVCSALMPACTSPPPAQTAAAYEQRCYREARTGTSIPSTRCVTPAVHEQDKRDVQETVDALRRAPQQSAPNKAPGN